MQLQHIAHAEILQSAFKSLQKLTEIQASSDQLHVALFENVLYDLRADKRRISTSVRTDVDTFTLTSPADQKSARLTKVVKYKVKTS